MYDQIKNKLRKAKNIVVFTGAGMSTESGIPDFRSAEGLYSEREYSGYAPEQILSRSFFLNKTEVFYKYYFSKIVHKDAVPNKGHKAIAALEEMGFNVTVITQNIDGLHTCAGSSKVIELHGSVYENYCMQCGKAFDLENMLAALGAVPACNSCGGILRPDVTLYEEPLKMESIAEAVSRIADADALFAIGSSLTVQPAAGLLDYFKGSLFVIINMDPTYYDRRADYVIRESCGNVLSELTDGLNE
ncbi:MAG: NAD-dependent protein deacylase [Clostridia bacterium]|nr:NAD-dependent protein deacylase [Clostridia bacterium]